MTPDRDEWADDPDRTTRREAYPSLTLPAFLDELDLLNYVPEQR